MGGDNNLLAHLIGNTVLAAVTITAWGSCIASVFTTSSLVEPVIRLTRFQYRMNNQFEQFDHRPRKGSPLLAIVCVLRLAHHERLKSYDPKSSTSNAARTTDTLNNPSENADEYWATIKYSLSLSRALLSCRLRQEKPSQDPNDCGIIGVDPRTEGIVCMYNRTILSRKKGFHSTRLAFHGSMAK